MLKKKSNPRARLKYLYVLPLAAIAVAAFARPEISHELNEISAVKVNDLTAMMKTDEVKSIETVPNTLQEKKIKLKGTIRDKEDNQPIVGACVLVKGTTNGTITDLDGNFTIEVPENSTLMVSFINYKSKEILVRPGMTKVDEVLEKDNSSSKLKGKVDGVSVVGNVPMEVNADTSPTFQVVEEMPEFPGGINECLKFLGTNIKYPLEAQKAGVQGRVIVQFIVEKDGTISNPKIVRGVNPDLDGEAIRVVSIMPTWEPGRQKGQPVRVKYTIPVTFRLNKKEEAKDSTMTTIKLNVEKGSNGLAIVGAANVFRVDGGEVKVLIVIDGVESSHEDMKKLAPSEIEAISVLKDDKAVAIYGEKAKEGAILITTKKK